MGKVDLHIGIDPELIEQAQRLGIAIAGMSESQLRLHLQKVDPTGGEERAKRWSEKNAKAIDEHNELIARRGLVSDRLRFR